MPPRTRAALAEMGTPDPPDTQDSVARVPPAPSPGFMGEADSPHIPVADLELRLEHMEERITHVLEARITSLVDMLLSRTQTPAPAPATPASPALPPAPPAAVHYSTPVPATPVAPVFVLPPPPPVHHQTSSGRLVAEFLKLKPPTFDGSTDPTVLDLWVQGMESRFRVGQYTQEDILILAPFQLQGPAHQWCTSHMEVLRKADWSSFKTLLTDRFVPLPVRRQLRDAFLHLKQDSRTVSDYEVEFTRLSKYAERFVTTEEDKLLQFVKGLRPNIRVPVKSSKPEDMTAALIMALEFEKDERDRRAYFEGQKKASHSGQSRQAAKTAVVSVARNTNPAKRQRTDQPQQVNKN